MERTHAYIMFSDIKGFSKLSEDELTIFAEEVWPNVLKIFRGVPDIKIFNTWGDAIFMVFGSSGVAKEIIAFRDYFRHQHFGDIGLPQLSVRIGCHFGDFLSRTDPQTGEFSVIGTNITTTARIEPVTRPNDIFVTKEFVDAFENSKDTSKPDNIEFDLIGDIKLAKNFGEHQVCLMRRSSDEKNIIDKIVKLDLKIQLPDAKPMEERQKSQLDAYKSLSPQDFKKMIAQQNVTDDNAEYVLKVASICKSKGLYDEAIVLIKKLEEYSIEDIGMNVYPYRNRVDINKVKANALSKIGEYQEASEIIYSLWKCGVEDSDTLSMLAAQYKRSAMYDENNKLQETFHREMLVRARDLYIEAFRRNIDDYYPAINAVYLNVILGGDDRGKGRRLANYIITAWKKDFGSDWWVSSTIAEAELINDGFEESIEYFDKALFECKPEVFDVASTLEQIKLYKFYIPAEPRIDDVIKVLVDYI